MAFNGSGVFVRIHNWVTDAANNIKITASRMDAEFDGMATGLSNCITKDGQTTVTQNIPFNSNRLTNLADPSAAQDAATKNYVDGLTTTTVKTITNSDSPYTLLAADKGTLILVDASSGSVTVNLLATATAADGFHVAFKRIAGETNTITLDGNSTETIDGATTVTINGDDDVVGLRCDGSNWQIDRKVLALIDEDDMSSDSATKVPSQQSVKAFVEVGSWINSRSEDTNPDTDADFVLTFDADASAAKKVHPYLMGRPVSHGDNPKATTSGTTASWASIPAGVEYIEIFFNGVSLSGTNNLLVQIGDSGGIETTGYVSRTTTDGETLSSTSGFIAKLGSAGQTIHGKMELHHLGSNLWFASYTFHTTTDSWTGSGTKTLSAELTTVQLAATGADSFDAGSAYLRYR